MSGAEKEKNFGNVDFYGFPKVIEVTSFQVVDEDYRYDPSEVVEQTEMGNITKIVFASGKIEYHIFDSQVGSSRVSISDGEKAEKAFNQKHIKRLGGVAMCLDI